MMDPNAALSPGRTPFDNGLRALLVASGLLAVLLPLLQSHYATVSSREGAEGTSSAIHLTQTIAASNIRAGFIMSARAEEDRAIDAARAFRTGARFLRPPAVAAAVRRLAEALRTSAAERRSAVVGATRDPAGTSQLPADVERMITASIGHWQAQLAEQNERIAEAQQFAAQAHDVVTALFFLALASTALGASTIPARRRLINLVPGAGALLMSLVYTAMSLTA